jgi:hypothetical protein
VDEGSNPGMVISWVMMSIGTAAKGKSARKVQTA